MVPAGLAGSLGFGPPATGEAILIVCAAAVGCGFCLAGNVGLGYFDRVDCETKPKGRCGRPFLV